VVSELSKLQKKVGEFGLIKFPTATPGTRVAHLKREVLELEEDHDPVEAADCVILLLGHAFLCGYDLYEEVLKKFEEIQTREWGDPDHEGVQEHIRE